MNNTVRTPLRPGNRVSVTSALCAAALAVSVVACGDSGDADSDSTITGASAPPTTGDPAGTGTEGTTGSEGTQSGGTDSTGTATNSSTEPTSAGPNTNATEPTSDSETSESGTDTGECFEMCSADMKNVVDCMGEVVEACEGNEGCDPQLLSCVDPCVAADKSKSSIGCEYYATLMHTFEDNPCFAAFVANTWDTPAHITVEYEGQELPVGDFAYLPEGAGPALSYEPYDDVAGLAPGEVAILFLAGPTNAMGEVNCPHPSAMPDGTQLKGTGVASSFRISTDAPVVAYQMNPFGGGSAAVTGASLLLPTSVWDDNYVVANAYQYFAPRVPSFNVVASEDNTTVTLEPVAAVDGGGGIPAGQAGQPLEFTLDAGEHAQISQQAELTGSVIQSDKPVGLMGGHECMRVPLGEEWCDHGEQMIPPVRALQAGDLAGHAVIFVARESFLQRGQRPGPGFRLRWIGDVDQDTACFDRHRIAAQPVAADQGVARLQMELPVMPVAGQHAAVRQRAFGQRIAFVRTAVVAGEHALGSVKQRDLLAGDLDDHPALVDQLGFGGGIDQRGFVGFPHVRPI